MLHLESAQVVVAILRALISLDCPQCGEGYYVSLEGIRMRLCWCWCICFVGSPGDTQDCKGWCCNMEI